MSAFMSIGQVMWTGTAVILMCLIVLEGFLSIKKMVRGDSVTNTDGMSRRLISLCILLGLMLIVKEVKDSERFDRLMKQIEQRDVAVEVEK